jgi:hypothetical protein
MEGIKTMLRILAMVALTYVMFSLHNISNKSDYEETKPMTQENIETVTDEQTDNI